MDIFKGLLWYTYKEERGKWFTLTVEQVHEIQDINKSGKKIAGLEDYEAELIETAPPIDFENVVGQDSLTRFDKPKQSNRKRRRKSGGNQNQNASKKPATNKTGNKPANKPNKGKGNTNNKQTSQNPAEKGAKTVNTDQKSNPKKPQNKRRRPPRNKPKTNE
jgi:hypothetical protein